MSDSIDATNPYRARTPWGSPAPVGPTAAAPIGVFDSGVGGLTVARAIMDQLPHERIIYVGDTAHDFSLTATDLSKKTLADFAGKKKVLSIIPSIDTGVCSTQTRRFNQELSDLDNTVVITVSVDLPFAQGKWCAAEGIENAVMLSDYFDHSFGRDYAVLINEWHLLARAVLVLDENNTVIYAEYVDNINTEPNFEAAIAAVKSL